MTEKLMKLLVVAQGVFGLRLRRMFLYGVAGVVVESRHDRKVDEKIGCGPGSLAFCDFGECSYRVWRGWLSRVVMKEKSMKRLAAATGI